MSSSKDIRDGALEGTGCQSAQSPSRRHNAYGRFGGGIGG